MWSAPEVRLFAMIAAGTSMFVPTKGWITILAISGAMLIVVYVLGRALGKIGREQAVRAHQKKPPKIPTTGSEHADKIKRSFIHEWWAFANSMHCPYTEAGKQAITESLQEIVDPLYWATAREVPLQHLLFRLFTEEIGCEEKLLPWSNCSSS